MLCRGRVLSRVELASETASTEAEYQVEACTRPSARKKQDCHESYDYRNGSSALRRRLKSRIVML